MVSVAMAQPCHFRKEAAIDNMSSDPVPVIQGTCSSTLKYEFYVTFTFHKISFSFKLKKIFQV